MREIIAEISKNALRIPARTTRRARKIFELVVTLNALMYKDPFILSPDSYDTRVQRVAARQLRAAASAGKIAYALLIVRTFGLQPAQILVAWQNAVRRGHIEIAKALVDHAGIDGSLEPRDNAPWQQRVRADFRPVAVAITAACMYDRMAMARWLVDHFKMEGKKYITPGSRNNNRLCFYEFAAQRGGIETVIWAVKAMKLWKNPYYYGIDEVLLTTLIIADAPYDAFDRHFGGARPKVDAGAFLDLSRAHSSVDGARWILSRLLPPANARYLREAPALFVAGRTAGRACADHRDLKWTMWAAEFVPLTDRQAWVVFCAACRHGSIECARWIADRYQLRDKAHIQEGTDVQFLMNEDLRQCLPDMEDAISGSTMPHVALLLACARGNAHIAEWIDALFSITENHAREMKYAACESGCTETVQWTFGRFKEEITKPVMLMFRARSFEAAEWIRSEFGIGCDDILRHFKDEVVYTHSIYTKLSPKCLTVSYGRLFPGSPFRAFYRENGVVCMTKVI